VGTEKIERTIGRTKVRVGLGTFWQHFFQVPHLFGFQPFPAGKSKGLDASNVRGDGGIVQMLPKPNNSYLITNFGSVCCKCRQINAAKTLNCCSETKQL